jgi:UPF0176 protein
MSILNISAYRFVSLDDLPALRTRVLAQCEALALKGTILLAPEGINMFLAGSREAIETFLSWLREDSRFADLEVKESLSDDVPFKRMRVRLKKEIITLRQPTIRPEGGRAPAVDPATLKRWLDQGHDDHGHEVVLLDTRNAYETDVGMFPRAVDYRIASFTELPAALADDQSRYEGKTVVSYCTGGIRCEKAALHMQDIGMQRVFQLEGGILKYFEEVGGAHWHGDCFVFDERGAVDKALSPSPLESLPLPSGERAGVRGESREPVESAQDLDNHSSHDAPPSPQPSP